MSPFLSGTSSPIPGGNGYNPKSNNGASTSQIPNSMAAAAAAAATAAASTGGGKGSGYASPALAYANAQLSQYAQQSSGQQPRQMNGNLFSAQVPQANNYASFFSQGTALPAHLNPHALSAALADYSSNSVPDSAASSPGQQYKRLVNSHSATSGFVSGTQTGASTPGGNSRVAASAITGKRLNWSEMICQTIAESETGKLVIQDLFEGMCNKFPEIREWAFGKDWEGRVKNRIKSTLSIKGNLFIKVPRPSSASGKGSWWTLSQEAQDAWKEGRVASVVKSGTHSRSISQSRGIEAMTSMSANTSRAGSRAPSRRGSPVSSRGPSSQHANQHSHTNSRGTPHQGFVNFSQDSFSSTASPNAPFNNQIHHNNNTNASNSASNRHSPSANLSVGLGMSPINFGSSSFEGLSMSGLNGMEGGMDDQMSLEPSTRRMRMMENSVNDSFDSSMTSGSVNLNMTSITGPSGNLYDMSPYSSYPSSATSQHFGHGPLQSAAHLGGPQSMPFPAGGDNGTSSMMSLSSGDMGHHAFSNAQQGNQAHQINNQSNNNSANSSSNSNSNHSSNSNSNNNNNNNNNKNNSNKMNQFDPSLFGGEQSFAHFGAIDLSNMEGMNNPFGSSMAGGYTMLNEGLNGSGAQPTPIPGRGSMQLSATDSRNGTVATPGNSFSANFIGGPSPANSSGSTSAFFAYTPAMMAADAASGGMGGSALGPVGGEGSKKKKQEGFSELQLPPQQ
ncbi:hypothetical protein CBS101457_002329 [Exobasidium rhododendri]|nr:hypothetical protein CBS101457_002329 [Exobasidium rhododendri]